MKRFAGIFEVAFDTAYLCAAYAIGIILLFSDTTGHSGTLLGIMAIVLAAGDSFHLLPRIMTILKRDDERFLRARGRGKQVASITMTVFYLLLWHAGVMIFGYSGGQFFYFALIFLAALRIVLCLMPQNRWQEQNQDRAFGILRNIPFFMMGVIVALLFYFNRGAHPSLSMMWLAIALSFAFYIPVVLFAGRIPKLGMLMLPKSCAYIWILAMFLYL